MAPAIVVSNRQKKVAVDLPEVELTAQRLADAVLLNLEERRVDWLKAKDVREMRKRGALSLVLVSNRKIREINREWRQKDAATDVLSFPLAVGDDHQLSRPFSDEEEWELGEVVISLERAQEQAAEYGHSFDREFAFLFVHGTLHILGFDHITKEQEREMFGRQGEILVAAGFPRQ